MIFVVHFARAYTERIQSAGAVVHVLSTRETERSHAIESLDVLPSLFAAPEKPAVKRKEPATKPVAASRPKAASTLLQRVKRGVQLASLPVQIRAARAHIAALQPDVVHALRIPFEGIIAAEAVMNLEVPLVTSVWGNDFPFRFVEPSDQASHEEGARADERAPSGLLPGPQARRPTRL